MESAILVFVLYLAQEKEETAINLAGTYLFAIRSGPYHFVASGTLTAPGTCTISIATANALQRSQHLAIMQTQNVQLDFNVESGDFSAKSVRLKVISRWR